VLYFSPDFRCYYLLYPPAWFAGVTELLTGNLAPRWLAFAGLATVALVVLGAVAIRKVARDYASFVSSLAYSESASSSNLSNGRSLKPRAEARAGRAWKQMFLSNTTERAVFELVSIYLRRNREVKVRLYPSLAYFIFIPLLAVLTEGLPDPFVNEGFRTYPLMGALMICYVALTAIEGMIFSEHYPAAYIYRVAPVAALGNIHNGFRKAVMVWVALPGFAMVFVLYSILWRNPLHAALVLLPWMLITPAVLMIPFLRREALPLSRKYQKGQQTARNFAVFLFCFIGLSVVAMIQVVAIIGRLPVVRTSFPYWVFLALTAMASSILYVLLRLLSGESTPVEPSDQWS
jgi:hypothetical protein